MTNCGVNSECCCASPEVTGGTYYRTYANSGSGPTGEADPATVSTFRFDKYLVTVGRFRRFVTAWNNGTGWLPVAGSGKHSYLNGGQGLTATVGGFEPGWVTSDDSSVAPTYPHLSICGGTSSDFSTWTPTVGAQENLPINCVTWQEAYAFCIWDGGFLPSEAEWEYAAAGGSQQLQYPWGSTDPGTANQYAIYGCYYPTGTATCTGVGNFATVGSTPLGAARWGQLDMSGEVLQWNLDWTWPYVDPCTDCASTTAPPNRVIRGGLCVTGCETETLTAPLRWDNPPADRLAGLGFRCARTP